MGSTNLSTKRQRIADLARTKAGTALSTLHHVIDLDWMKEAYRLTRKDGAPGIDGVTAKDYEANLEANLLALLERIKSGSYVAPPVRRVYIPKADGSERPLGIPTFEDNSTLVRYADDCVLAVSTIEEAKRVLGVLGQRLGRYGLTLHPIKTRLVDFRYRRPGGQCHSDADGTTFDFLGFTHVWGKTWQGKTRVWQVTAKSRYARALAAVSEWCRRNRHLPMRYQHAHLSMMMRGHYAYYGISGNSRRIRWFAWQVVRV